MAVNDVIGIKYMVPKLKFEVNPASSQSYTLYYRLWSSSADDGNAWTTVSSTYTANVYGENTNRIAIAGLADNTSYQFKLVNNADNSKVYISQFHTGTTIGLSDSPYYNKVLFPGQIYDWYGADLNTFGIPTGCTCYYKLDSHYSESIVAIQDSWSSLLAMPLPANPDLSTGKFKKVVQTYTSEVELSMTGFYVNEGSYLALPHKKWDDTSKSYVYTEYDFDGTITAYGMLSNNKWSLAFVFFCETGSIGTNEITILNMNTSGYVSYVHKYRIYINLNGYLCYSCTNGSSVTNTTSTIKVSEGKMYYAYMGSSEFGIYEAVYNSATDTFTFTNYEMSAPAPIGTNGSEYQSTSSKTPFCFGDSTTSGLVIGKIVVAPNSSKDEGLIKMLLIPNAYQPVFDISCKVDSISKNYKLTSKYLVTITNKKASFLMPLDLITRLGGTTASTITDVSVNLTSNDSVIATKTFSGFSYPSGGTTVTTSGIIDTAAQVEDSFDINFSTSADRVTDLQRYFFTKHGTWGGYNGGVNGHLIYFDANGNLILEQHGDHYKGTVTGVAKESKSDPYTGYGDALSLSSGFDTRSNKNCLRTGCALVSNKYMGYGEIDVWWRFPVGIWGICPAIWLFHYIEISDIDYRFDLSPWNLRNKQGSADDGFYRVVNNEIDIELPSHRVQGTMDISSLPSVFFDPDAMDDKTRVGFNSSGTYRLKLPSAPNSINSWVKESDTINPRYLPSYNTCKFNNWHGELYNGNGWRDTQDDYMGVGDGSDTIKEEYLALLTKLSDNINGYADGQFHKWTIKWLPNKTVLYVDDVLIRENKCFIPFNVMKLTIAGWFPTMKLAGDSSGVVDADGIRGSAGAIVPASNTQYIGTWAGNEASFEIAHFIVNRIKYVKYKSGDTVEGYTFKDSDFTNMKTYGESFPESGLRQFLKE